MRPFLFHCPSTGLKVQAVDEIGDSRPGAVPFRLIHCIACQRVHLIRHEDCHYPPDDPAGSSSR